jgi:hypothetical protein
MSGRKPAHRSVEIAVGHHAVVGEVRSAGCSRFVSRMGMSRPWPVLIEPGGGLAVGKHGGGPRQWALAFGHI